MPSAFTGAETLGARYLTGSASNFVRQPAQQKWKIFPPCSKRCLDVAGFTFIPQTGSVTVVASVAPSPPDGWSCRCSSIDMSPGSSPHATMPSDHADRVSHHGKVKHARKCLDLNPVGTLMKVRTRG